MTTLLAVGNLFTDLPAGDRPLAPLAPLLEEGDAVLAGCEGVYSDRPAPAPSRRHGAYAARSSGEALADLPVGVVNLANPHLLDGGYVGMEDTVELLRSQGRGIVGAGGDLDQAASALVVDAGGARIAFIGLSSVFPQGYEARQGRPGLNPLRVETHYLAPDRDLWDPGAPPQIITSVDAADWDRVVATIRGAGDVADLVAVGCRWTGSGGELRPYERRLAHALVESGADAVLCHHDTLRPAELHHGRPIFYGLGTLTPSGPARESQRDTPDRAAVAVVEHDGASLRAGMLAVEVEAGRPVEPIRADDERAAAALSSLGAPTGEGWGTELEPADRDGWAFARLISSP